MLQKECGREVFFGWPSKLFGVGEESMFLDTIQFCSF